MKIEMEHFMKNIRFAICINNEGYEDDLKIRTLYQVIPDESAEKSDYLRVIDETGEDYLYPAEYFLLINVPRTARQVLLKVYEESVLT